MTNSRDSSTSSRSDIVGQIDAALGSFKRYQELRRASERSEERTEIVSGIASALETILDAYISAVWNYKLLSFIFEQSSDQDLKIVSERIDNILSNVIKDPLSVYEIDISTYNKINKELSEINQALQTLNPALSMELNAYQESWLQKIAFVNQVLRIPDLANALTGRQDLISCMNQLKAFFEDSRKVQEIEKLTTLKEKWSGIKVKFESYKSIESYEGIKQAYNFSDETIAVIKRLLEGSELFLDSIKPQVLKDLYKFRDFCKAVALKLKSPEEEEGGEV